MNAHHHGRIFRTAAALQAQQHEPAARAPEPNLTDDDLAVLWPLAMRAQITNMAEQL